MLLSQGDISTDTEYVNVMLQKDNPMTEKKRECLCVCVHVTAKPEITSIVCQLMIMPSVTVIMTPDDDDNHDGDDANDADNEDAPNNDNNE